jgi:predicted nuclease with TOPRIM domain
MISISNDSLKKYSKYIIVSIVAYTIFFMASTVVEYIKAYKEKEQLTNTLQLKRDETTSLKQRINNLKDKTKFIQEAYVKEDELRVRVKEIFDRVSLLDYQLKLLDVKNECIDRHILVVNLSAKSENGYKVGEGILKYLGETIKSEQSENLYFVNYVSMQRGEK